MERDLRLWSRALGHWWTVRPYLKQRGDAANVSAQALTFGGGCGRRWPALYGAQNASVGDAAAPLVVLLHGLGAEPTSLYMEDAARRLAIRGYASLRLGIALRADGSSAHGYHALDEDLEALTAAVIDLHGCAPALWLGFSMGGHKLLELRRTSTLNSSPVATICAPVHLSESLAHFERRRSALYRRLMLRWVDAPRGTRSLAAWAKAQPGFEGASGAPLASVGPLLMLTALEDPFVPLRSALMPADGQGQQRVRRGGHLGFPPGTLCPVEECLDWLEGGC